MSDMFYWSMATTINLTGFDTSNVTDMSFMFAFCNASSLDVSSFDTRNVTRMNSMFYSTKIPTLDLSSFDTSNVTDTKWMFSGAAATTGYGKTQADCDRLNASSDKPAGLVFVVKGS